MKKQTNKQKLPEDVLTLQCTDFLYFCRLLIVYYWKQKPVLSLEGTGRGTGGSLLFSKLGSTILTFLVYCYSSIAVWNQLCIIILADRWAKSFLKIMAEWCCLGFISYKTKSRTLRDFKYKEELSASNPLIF